MPYVDVLGRALFYRAPRGLPGPGTLPMLCLHGFGGSGRQFEHLVSLLSPHVSPILLDLPGHGSSSGRTSTEPADVVTVVDTFLSSVHCTQPVCCLGHSLGGVAALELAATYPARVTSLVLLATAQRVRLHPRLVQQASTGAWDFEWLRAAFSPGTPAESVAIATRDLAFLRFDGDGALVASPSRPISRVDCPTLAVIPQHDIVVSPRRGGDLARSLRQAVTWRIAAGHYVHLEAPHAVAAAINAFLSGDPLFWTRAERDSHVHAMR